MSDLTEIKRWEVIDKGTKFWIYERADGFFMAGANYRDGSTHQMADWWPSYRTARNYLYTDKRIKAVRLSKSEGSEGGADEYQ